MSHNNVERNKCKLVTMFTLNFCFFLVELGVGSYCNSMALVADSFHMLSDVAALVVAYFAVKMSQKKWSRNTFGWARAEVLGALVNSVFLVALCFSIFIDSVKRFIEPENIKDPELLLIVGTIGLLMNVVGLCIFREPHSHSHGHSHKEAERDRSITTLTHSNRLTRMVQSSNQETTPLDNDSVSNASVPVDSGEASPRDPQSKGLEELTPPNNNKGDGEKKSKPKKKRQASQMNLRGVFLHLMADTLGSVVVVISALIVWQVDWEYNKYIDPCLSIVMVFLILMSVYPLLVESSLILLQSVPDHIKVDELEKKLLKQIDGVLGVHELHVWQLAGDRIIATAHIKCRTLQEYFEIAGKVICVFHNEGIHSTTIQPEFSQQSPIVDENGVECYLSCSSLSANGDCNTNKCCPTNKEASLKSVKSQHP